MGGFSASTSKSKSSNTTSTTSTDKRIGIEGGGVVATEGAEVIVENLSGDVIVSALEQGFDFGKAAIEEIADTKIEELKSFTDASENLQSILKAGTAIAVVYFVARAWGKR